MAFHSTFTKTLQRLFCIALMLFVVGQEPLMAFANERLSVQAKIETQMQLQDLMQKARQGDPKAQEELGFDYYYGEIGLKPDKKRAFELLNPLIKQSGYAAYAVSYMYLYGQYVKVNPSKAVEVAQIGAELGDVNCMTVLGNAYQRGDGAKTNFYKSSLWYISSIVAALFASIKTDPPPILPNLQESLARLNKVDRIVVHFDAAFNSARVLILQKIREDKTSKAQSQST
jgi:hypothetical protein